MRALGIRRARNVNKALLAKQGWQMHAITEKTWVKMARAKYVKDVQFLSTPIKKSAIMSWKGIGKMRDLLKKRVLAS
jgi:hypothetical protein